MNKSNIKSVSILGSGFGLYGYMPAAFSLGLNVKTLSRYKGFIRKRDDIKHFIDQIEFFDNDKQIIEETNLDLLIMARRPVDNEKLINSLNILKYLLIEKPIARNYEKAMLLQSKIIKSVISYRIGFSMLSTDWYKNIFRFYINSNYEIKSLNIKWLFKAPHYKNKINTWKSNYRNGGGAFNFYGSHLLALLASIDNWSISNFISYRRENLGEYKFRIIAKSGNNTICDLTVDTNYLHDPVFEVILETNGDKVLSFFDKSPFHYLDNSKSLYDNRVSLLKTLIESFHEDNKKYYNIYDNYIDLWNQCESKIIINI